MPDGLTNRFLFSHHYLERICQEASDRTEAAQLIADLSGWTSGWDDRSISSLLNTQIYPTLVSLGFDYDQTSNGGDPHLLRLYATYRHENLVGLCYVAHRQDEAADLDCTIKGRHYAAEIVHALQEEDLDWGLLTDGIRWRLYHAAGPTPYETFLEIDLDPLLRGEPGVEDAAYLFHLLFTEPAFEASKDDECALDRHLSASEGEASAIEKHLSNCIEDVLRDLCQGFVERDGQEAYTSDERDEVFHDATVLLYRLLFILYAEARDLLPLEEPEYHSASLDALVERAVREVKVTGLADPDGTQLWRDLSDLCSWINSGDADHHIPAYNGNLFDDSDKRYIHDHTIADKYLAPALFSLGAIEEGTEARFRRIDYRDLSVRHLGSIYEGLLEYKLFIAQERRVRRADGKGGYTFPKLSETRLKKGEEDEVIEVGDVYFAHSAGERKAMGAYYTPEYIVDYIVKQTARRGLEERRASLEEQLPGWLEEVETASPEERQRLQQVVDQKLLDFVEQEVLTFRLCDPAMGSGHFLVNAAHNITSFIVETLNLTPWENPTIDSDPAVWRRQVAKRCLYGVDLNELAVELAKLSLWLTTAEKGRPLSFLNHHLRHGNSLIGARLEDLIKVFDQRTPQEKKRQAAGQMSMFDEYPGFHTPLREATDLVREISAQVADVAEDVKAQTAAYERVRHALKPYRDLANLITAQHFGLNVDEKQLRAIAHLLMFSKSELPEEQQALLYQANGLARSWNFFHWGLEFPEVYFSEDKRPNYVGFQAVIGNPPYRKEPNYDLYPFIESNYILPTKSDPAELFLERSLQLVQSKLSIGMIVPKPITYTKSWQEARELLGKYRIRNLVDCFEAFENVLLEQVILVIEKNSSTRSYEFQVGVVDDQEMIPLGCCSSSRLGSERYSYYAIGSRASIFDKVKKKEKALGELAEMWEGPGYNKYVSDSGVYKCCKGSDVQRYEIRSFGYLPASKEPPNPSRYRQEKILLQRIVAHVTHPVSRIILMAAFDEMQVFTVNTLTNIVGKGVATKFLLALLNSRFISWWAHHFLYNRAVRSIDIYAGYAAELPIRNINFSTPLEDRKAIVEKGTRLYRGCIKQGTLDPISEFVNDQLDCEPERSDVIHDLLSYCADHMVKLHKKRQRLESEFDLLRYVDAGQPFVQLADVLAFNRSERTEELMDLESVRHDIDDLRLVPNPDGTWTLELQAKFRDPEQGWQEWIKEEDEYSIKRRWVPAYRLQMSEEKARFYHYALPRLQDFDNARSFPGGYTRSTLQKLHATKVPMMPDVDLRELARLDQELSETRRKIARTDDLIDQIVYKLYGLTEEEIAIVEGES